MDSTDLPRATAPMRRRVTAAMVAEHAGVSTATVSLVANGKTQGRVSAANEAKVLDAIRELGTSSTKSAARSPAASAPP